MPKSYFDANWAYLNKQKVTLLFLCNINYILDLLDCVGMISIGCSHGCCNLIPLLLNKMQNYPCTFKYKNIFMIRIDSIKDSLVSWVVHLVSTNENQFKYLIEGS